MLRNSGINSVLIRKTQSMLMTSMLLLAQFRVRAMIRDRTITKMY